MASPLNFHRKMPSEIQRTDKLPSAEILKSYGNAYVEYDGTTYYVVWKKLAGFTKAAINAKKFGVGSVWYAKNGRDYKPISDSGQSIAAWQAFNKIIQTSKGMVWWVEETKKAEKNWKLAHAA